MHGTKQRAGRRRQSRLDGVETLESRALLAVADVPIFPVPPASTQTLQAAEVRALLNRASAATASNDAIIAIVDRQGRILGVRVESGVSPAITSDPARLVFAVDGAVAKARTGAFFGSNEAPLTSRTINNISQTTMTLQEIESNPNILDP